MLLVYDKKAIEAYALTDNELPLDTVNCPRSTHDNEITKL